MLRSLKFRRSSQIKVNFYLLARSDNCLAIEYPSKDKRLNGSIIKLSGRYPDSGRVYNLKCKELFYIVSGSGIVEIEGNKNKISKGDLIFIEPKEKYFWKGKIEMFVASSPAWNPKQQKRT